MFRSRPLLGYNLLSILAVSVPFLSELRRWHLPPPGRGISEFNSLLSSCGQVQSEAPGFHSTRLSRRHFPSKMSAHVGAEILRSTVSNAVVRTQMLSHRALREQKESKQRVLFSISYKYLLFQPLLNHILTNSGGGGFFSWHRIVSGCSLVTTHYSPLTIDCSLPPPLTSTDRCGATPHA
jgi:hypothetical protein